MKKEKIVFENKGQKIAGILHLPDSENPPAIIMVHGFGGYAFSSRFEKVARILCENGFSVLRFGFRGYDESDGKLKDITISGEISDLKSAIDFMEKQKINRNRIGLICESFGGVIAILCNDKRIKAAVFWAPFIFLEEVFIKVYRGMKEVKELEKKGFIEYISRTTGEKRIMGVALWKEVKKIGKISKDKIKNIDYPILIIHGEKDTLVDLKNSKELHKIIQAPKRLEIIENAGHGSHLFEKHEDEKQAIALSLQFFKKWLK